VWTAQVWNLPPTISHSLAHHGLGPRQTPSNGADNAASTRITGNRNAVLPRPWRIRQVVVVKRLAVSAGANTCGTFQAVQAGLLRGTARRTASEVPNLRVPWNSRVWPGASTTGDNPPRRCALIQGTQRNNRWRSAPHCSSIQLDRLPIGTVHPAGPGTTVRRPDEEDHAVIAVGGAQALAHIHAPGGHGRARVQPPDVLDSTLM
jgi:hypothetical protein